MSDSIPEPAVGDSVATAPTPASTPETPTVGFPWHDRLLLLLMLSYLGLLGCLWGAHLEGTRHAVKITPFDSIAPPGSATELVAKFERDGPGLINPDLEKVEIRLLPARPPGWTEAAQAITDDDGIARHPLAAAPKTAGVYFFRGGIVDAGKYSVRDPDIVGALYVVPGDRPVIICDIDDTITQGKGWKSLMRGDGPEAQEGAATTLRALGLAHQLVFLTARDDALLNRSRTWLVANGFPYPVPVICRDWTVRKASATGEAKLASLKKLQKHYKTISWGIGNSEGDCEAYRAAGIPHVSLEGGHCADHGKPPDEQPPCHGVTTWDEIRALLLPIGVGRDG